MKRKVSFLLVLFMFWSIIGNSITPRAAVNYVTGVRNLNPNVMYIDGEADVTLQITGTPPVNVVKPNDIMVVLDKSGSMQNDNRFNAMKESAKEFVNLIDFDKHSVGIVDYSSLDLVNSTELSTDADSLKSYIDKIQLGGWTETATAIRTAMDKLSRGREEAQPVILLLTDGEAQDTADALRAAQEAKEAGIVFYTIALLGPNENPDSSAANQLMKDMATTSHHHHFVLGSVGLIDIYRAIVQEIGVASAYDVTITETVSPEFEIVPGSYEDNIPRPTVNGNTLTWNMLELKNQTLDLSYKVRLKDGVSAGKYNITQGSKVTYKDYTGKACTYTIPNQILEVKNYPPTITSIEKDKGNVAGGENVTIKGTNFRNGAIVKFNSNLATDVVVLDSNTITAKVPAGTQGTATVTVTNDDKASASVPFYYYADPIVTSITPTSGLFEGGTQVKIYGNYFMSDIKVYFGSEEATVKYYNSGYLIATAPKAVNSGLVDITLTNGDSTTITVQEAFNYEEEIIEELEIHSLEITTGPQVGGTRLKLYGKNIDNGAKVFFGTEEATIVSYYNSNYLLLSTPKQSTGGMVDVTIENLDGTRATLTEGFYYIPTPAPVIDTISITSGVIEGGETMVITGENFNSAIKVTIGGNDAQIVRYFSSTQVSVKVPAGVEGNADVTVTNPDGQSDTKTGAYEYLPPPPAPAPEITVLSLTSGQEIGGELIYIDGKNFVDGLTFSFGNNDAQVLNFYSSNRIRVRVPAGVAGKVDVTLTNPDGQSVVVTEGYEYLAPPKAPAPEITALSASEGSDIGGDLIYIEGLNFQSGLTVDFGTVPAEVLNYYNSSKIRVRVPANSRGTVTVTVTNPDGEYAELVDGFTYTEVKPEITLLAATSGKLEGGELINISGKNFISGLKVYFGGVEAQIMNFYNSTSIRIRVPAATNPGTVDVTIVNPNGATGIAANAYTYEAPPATPAPIIDCFTSNGVLSNKITEAKANTIIYGNGKGFATGLSLLNIYDTNGNLVVEKLKPLNVYDSLKLRFRVPATLTPGSYKISVVNPDGQESTPIDLLVK